MTSTALLEQYGQRRYAFRIRLRFVLKFPASARPEI